ncbi:hypothetical protein [Galbibacter mesophilus]|uniref:hypothetical protein n=1 Tax=Galbibacter mesophilus TaxID=379069 RepID=UPI00191D3002|nr:hypothetical protein [Galbibacter mesophilus]MCM5661354.1 hypothetical protein [Galbibacter mesophilus]
MSSMAIIARNYFGLFFILFALAAIDLINKSNRISKKSFGIEILIIAFAWHISDLFCFSQEWCYGVVVLLLSVLFYAFPFILHKHVFKKVNNSIVRMVGFILFFAIFEISKVLLKIIFGDVLIDNLIQHESLYIGGNDLIAGNGKSITLLFVALVFYVFASKKRITDLKLLLK